MPKYLWKASYTTKGVRGVANEGGSSRRDAVKQVTESVGGTLRASTSPSVKTTPT